MPPKRKVSKNVDNSQAGEVLPVMKQLTKRPRPEELFNNNAHLGEFESS